jgi:hypothetical protein
MMDQCTYPFDTPSIQITLKWGFHKTPDLTIERLEREITFSGWILPPARRHGAHIKSAAAVKLSKREAYGCCSNGDSQQSQAGDESRKSAEIVYLQMTSS